MVMDFWGASVQELLVVALFLTGMFMLYSSWKKQLLVHPLGTCSEKPQLSIIPEQKKITPTYDSAGWLVGILQVGQYDSSLKFLMRWSIWGSLFVAACLFSQPFRVVCKTSHRWFLFYKKKPIQQHTLYTLCCFNKALKKKNKTFNLEWKL